MSGAPDAARGAASLRMFYALWPGSETRALIAAAARAIACGAPARLVPAENYHLTIAFVGEVSVQQLPILQQIGASLAAASSTIRFDAYEYWPKPEVVVAAAREIPASLENCWRALHQNLANRGFALDPKRLRPHVTLARKVTQAPVPTPMSPITWRASDFCLVRSSSDGTRAAYTVVDTWPLLDEA